MERIGEKLRVVVDIHDLNLIRAVQVAKINIFEGELEFIAGAVFTLLEKTYKGEKNVIGATISGGTVPIDTPPNSNVEMQNLRQHPEIFPPHTYKVSSEDERNLLVKLGFADAIRN